MKSVQPFLRSLLTRVAFVCGLAGMTATSNPVFAAEDVVASSRLRLAVLHKGDTEIVNFGSLEDLTDTDLLIVVLIGTGNATLTVTDADATGDTIQASGTLLSFFPINFSQSATSPASVEQPLLVQFLGLAIVNIQYTNIVNSVPASYFYSVEF